MRPSQIVVSIERDRKSVPALRYENSSDYRRELSRTRPLFGRDTPIRAAIRASPEVAIVAITRTIKRSSFAKGFCTSRVS